MTPRITAAAAVMLAVLVAKVMAVSIMAGTLLVCVLAVTIGSYVVSRLTAVLNHAGITFGDGINDLENAAQRLADEGAS